MQSPFKQFQVQKEARLVWHLSGVCGMMTGGTWSATPPVWVLFVPAYSHAYNERKLEKYLTHYV